MSFIRDKSVRKFFAGIIVFLFLLFLFDIMTGISQKNAVRKILIRHDNAIVSSLLQQGIAEDVAATAITSTKNTQDGEILLNKLGVNENTDILFLPAISDFSRRMVLADLIKSIVLIVFLLIMVFLFLWKRECLYKQAIRIVSDYTEGRFNIYLPQSNNGTIYQLFSSINNMASVLKSKQETEHSTKEFLKNTISDISHQLKTPLAALSMYNEIILDEPTNISTVVAFAQKSDTAIERIKTLILSLLKITRLDAGGINFEKKEYPITKLIDSAIENLTIRAVNEKKHMMITGSQEETIMCDFNWTSEAIGNIVKNAFDHIGTNGEIRISWERIPGQVRIFIADNGRGIIPEDLHHIFKRFYRSKNSADTQGIGLGLPLAKAVVEGQNGIISVQSEQGEGTTFIITFCEQ